MSQLDPRFFCYKEECFGGTEYMARRFHKEIAPHIEQMRTKYNCLVLPGATDIEYQKYVIETKPMIIWLHNCIDQFGFPFYLLFTDKRFLEKVDFIITVSEWHRQHVIEKTGITSDKIIVIPNAIDPVNNDKTRFKNVKVPEIIYTSSTGRGVEIGLTALSELDIDFRLNVFNEIMPDLIKIDDSNKKILTDPRFYFYGKTPHRTVLDHMSKSHIFIHTSTWEETFCISLAEALSAGCLSVYSTKGSLQEVGNSFGIPYDIDNKTQDQHLEIFKEKITVAINMIKDESHDPTNQATIINKKYSWQIFKYNWMNFYEKIN